MPENAQDDSEARERLNRSGGAAARSRRAARAADSSRGAAAWTAWRACGWRDSSHYYFKVDRPPPAPRYATSTVQITDEAWAVTDEFAILNSDEMADYAAGGSAPPDQGVKCQALSTDTTIRVAPMERFCGGWSTEHFNDKLRLPDGSNAGQGMVVQLEGMARECLVIALSPYHKYELGKTYAIHFGANGNMQTVLRRHVNYNEAVDVSIPSRVCAENTWVHYWIILQNGKLSAGVGKVPGKHVIGVLDDSMYNMLRSGVDAVKYVGLGNSALQRNARDLKVRNVRVMGIPPQYQEGIPLDESGGFGFVNVNNLGYGTSHTSQQSTGMPNDSELLAEYERERAKAKARAEKFGIEYKEPAADAFLKWSEARRLRANPERGFITGIDTFSVEEKQKALNRKERFAQDERKRKGRDDDGGDGNDEEDAEIIDDDVDDVAEWEKTKKDPLPVEQAWENWKIVQRFRVDCPAGLLNKDGTQATEDEIELTADAANDVWHGVSTVGDPGNDSAMVTTDNFIPRKVSIVPTKIHLFSNDWAPFKQIRTDDVMAYFRDYGPSYVEWLGKNECIQILA
ncbi:hypothetical protein THAOC_18716 [Thalassiosira oceanica]|uniref:Uncharacterized protein n=1 Tax=Thalassiosira oceanica TaxID=159749 RepID=K0S7G4_THAOC|nr:hypothetical protein THAOC_18716 [Thalassiosira oceanica]|eukprot:EJK60874.1 hypothetical protein THAOC_18716 [Thalassiosira oceanica]